MKKLLIALTAASAIGIAAPAAAQNYQYNPNARGAVSFDNRIVNLNTRLEAGVRSGTISRGEASLLRSQLRQIADLERRYSMNGLTREEQRDLQQRIRSLRQQIRTADNNSYDRYEQRDMWAEYDGYGNVYGQRDDRRYDPRYDPRSDQRYDPRYGQRADQRYDPRYDQRSDPRYDNRYGQRDDQRYDNRYDQRYDNRGYSGVGGGYEEVSQVCASRGIIGNILGGLLGGGGGNSCLRVGQRVSGNLGYVPSRYQNEFRDGGGFVYRYLEGNVIQIDARTGVVARIWDVE